MDKHSIKNLIFIILFFLISPNLIPEISEEKNADPHLRDYLLFAAENNPGLKAAFNRWKAELEKVIQVRTLPDPTFNFAYFISEVETRVGAQQMKVGLMQKFPWFGKLKLKGEKVLERALAYQENFERVKLELFYKVKKLYYDYYFVSRSIQIVNQNILLLETVTEQITSMYSTGIASYSNLIRMQVELDKLTDRKKGLEIKLPSIRAAINAVMNRSFEKEIIVKSKIENLRFYLGNSSMVPLLRKNNPELKILDHFTLSREAGVKLEKKNYFPDISFGADVIITGDSTIPGVTDSGKDPFLLKMSLNLPIRFKKINASIKEAKNQLDAVKYERIEKENKLISTLQTALFNFNDSGRIVKLYLDSLIPKALQAFEVTKTAFSTGKTGFLDFIDSQRTLLEFELILEKARSTHYQHLARIEKIVGKDSEYLIEKKHLIQEKQ